MGDGAAAEVSYLLRVLYPVIILNTLSVGMLWPSLPAILEAHFDGETSAVASLSAKINAVNAVLDFVSNPVLGSLSDTYGRKPFLLQSLCVAAVCNALVAIVATPAAVVGTKIALGLCNVSKAMIYAMVVDVMNRSATSQGERVRLFGLIGVASGIGFALGPAVGGLLGFLFSPRIAVAAAAAAVGASAAWAFVALDETRAGDSKPVARGLQIELCSSLKHAAVLVQNRQVACFAVPFVLSGVAAGPYAIWYFYSEKKYGWGYGTISLFLFLYGAASITAQGLLLPLLTPRVLNEFATVALGFFANALVFALYGTFTVTHGLLPFAVLPLCLITSLSEPVLRNVFSRLVSPQEQGALQGALAALGTFASACGPLLASALLSLGSARCDNAVSAASCSSLLGTPFFVSSALFVLASATTAVAFSYWERRRPDASSFRGKSDAENRPLLERSATPPTTVLTSASLSLPPREDSQLLCADEQDGRCFGSLV